MKNFVFGFFIILAISGCSQSDSTKGAAAATVNEGFTAVTTSLQSVDAIMADDSSVVPTSIAPFAAGSMSLIWAGTNFMPEPRCSGSGAYCGQSVTMKNYISFVLDKDAVRGNGSSISVFGRIKTQLAASCLLTSVLGATPAAGTQNFTFDAAVIATGVACGFGATDLDGMAGQTASATVSIPADTTYYDRKFVLNLGDVIEMYVRVSATNVNILSAESGARTAIALNRTTGVMRAEYISRDSSGSRGGEFHRIHYDPTTNLANIIGSSFDNGSPANKLFFTMVGRPNVANAHVAFSVAVNGFGLTVADAGAIVGPNYYNGCVNQTTGALAIADTLTCTGITGVSTLGAVTTLFTNMDSSTLSATAPFRGATGFGETRTVPFTNGSDLFTSAVLIGP